MAIIWMLLACVVVGVGLGLIARLTPLEIAAKVGLMSGVGLLFAYLVSLLAHPPAH